MIPGLAISQRLFDALELEARMKARRDLANVERGASRDVPDGGRATRCPDSHVSTDKKPGAQS